MLQPRGVCAIFAGCAAFLWHLAGQNAVSWTLTVAGYNLWLVLQAPPHIRTHSIDRWRHSLAKDLKYLWSFLFVTISPPIFRIFSFFFSLLVAMAWFSFSDVVLSWGHAPADKLLEWGRSGRSVNSWLCLCLWHVPSFILINSSQHFAPMAMTSQCKQ